MHLGSNGLQMSVITFKKWKSVLFKLIKMKLHLFIYKCMNSLNFQENVNGLFSGLRTQCLQTRFFSSRFILRRVFGTPCFARDAAKDARLERSCQTRPFSANSIGKTIEI